MKDKLTIGIVGTIPGEIVKNYAPEFNPNNFDADEITETIIKEQGGEYLISLIMNQYNNEKLRAAQKRSIDYFNGNTDVKNEDVSIMVKNPFTGTYTFDEKTDISNLRVSSNFHKQVIGELTNYAIGTKNSETKLSMEKEISEGLEEAIKNFGRR